jgi:hypothetical protein
VYFFTKGGTSHAIGLGCVTKIEKKAESKNETTPYLFRDGVAGLLNKLVIFWVLCFHAFLAQGLAMQKKHLKLG